MRNFICRWIVLAGCLGWCASAARADEEQDLIAILKSDTALPAKAEACRRLRVAGTVRSVPVLASLLGEEERIAHAARYTLEGLPFPEAVVAIREALGRTAGPVKAGLIDSLGWRGDVEAVPLLAAALADPDRIIAGAAAAALGRLGTDDAQRNLVKVRDRVSPELGRTVKEGLLACAERRAAEGRSAEAIELYRSLLVPAEEPNLRQAAYAGWIRVAGEGAPRLVLAALEGDDPALRAAALRVAGDLRDPALAAGLRALWPQARPELRGALIALFRERGDREALPMVLEAAGSGEGPVRPAALAALGSLGEAANVPLLLSFAASEEMAAQTAARESLATLSRGDVTGALVAEVGKVPPMVEREIFRALSARAETSAVPALLTLGRSDRPATRAAALQALGMVADGRQLEPLLRLLVDAPDAEARRDVVGVFETLIERRGAGSALDPGPVVDGISRGIPATRVAVLPVASLIPDARIRTALLRAATDPDSEVRGAAIRAMAASRDPALLPDLLVLARSTTDEISRSLAIGGCLRLATEDESGLAPRARAEALEQALAACTKAADRRAVVAGLGHVPDRAALAVVERAARDPEVRAEAEQASLRLAERLGSAEFESVEAALRRLAAEAGSPTIRSNAQGVLARLDSGWLQAGPYRQAGKTAEALFDVAFDPEGAGAAGVTWRRAPGSADPARAGEVDLGSVTGGDHCVVYLRTRVLVSAAGEVAFAIGSDDGIKLWVNGTLVHANNAVRGLTPGQDRARGRLREGWNDLLAKITQHTAGCGMTLRITNPDGSAVPGLRIDPRGAAAAAP